MVFVGTPFPLRTFLLVKRAHLYFLSRYVRRKRMAEVEHVGDEQSLEKAVWHYVGVAVLWLALFFSGMACERLGLTSFILTGILPGETGSLRTKLAECDSNLKATTQTRDEMMRSKQALEVEVSRLKKAATPATQ
jgi:hypothetical protein